MNFQVRWDGVELLGDRVPSLKAMQWQNLFVKAFKGNWVDWRRRFMEQCYRAKRKAKA